MFGLDPLVLTNLLYLVLVAGVWLTVLAVVTPGTGILEVLVLAALVITGMGAFYTPFNPWAFLILGAGVLALVISLRRKPFEIWLLLSALLFSAGSIFLYRLEDGRLGVHPLLAIVVSLMTVGYFWWAIRGVIEAQHQRPVQDPTALVGQVAEVRTAMDPVGSVYVAGEMWSARSQEDCTVGDKVRVTGVDGLTLEVIPVNDSEA
ncbi:MAG: NfeD family protein [Anaerolineales bacterium]|jgi:membrane-bound serine protease (ClpP class)